MSVAENLLFGTPIGSEFDLEHLGKNAYMRSVLTKVGLDETFLNTGIRIATIMIELFQDLPPDHEYFERYSFIGADELPEFQQLVRRVEAGGNAVLSEEERSLLLSLPFMMVAGRHRLGVMDEGILNQILRARKLFAAELPDNLRGAVAFFDAQAYNAAATIQDNVLFGKVVYGRREAGQQIADLIRGVIRELDLENELIEAGLEAQVGVSGGRLSTSQAQKVAIARCVLKRPDILVVNDATAALDPGSQAAIANGLFAEFKGRGIVWVVSRLDNLRQFDHAIVMQGGKVHEYGKIETLDQPGRALHALLNGT
jgi:ABC-type iron transport system FetAB ATPase subunit